MISDQTDFTSSDLRSFSRRSDDHDQVRRVAVALILDGSSQSGGTDGRGNAAVVRNQMLWFNEGGPEGLAMRKAPFRP